MRYVNCSFMFFFAGATPFMASAQSGDISTVKYLLDHGGDLMKADAKGRTVLHHAVCAG
jgi:ankyrin repeat protein